MAKVAGGVIGERDRATKVASEAEDLAAMIAMFDRLEELVRNDQ